jgi:hypothetical protein
METQGTSSELFRKIQLMNIGMMVVGLGIVIAVAVVSWTTDRPFLEWLTVGILVLLVVTLLRRLLTRTRYVRMGRRVVLDLGPHPMQRSLLLLSALTCASRFCFVMARVTGETENSRIPGMLVPAVLALSTFFMAFERSQLFEDGISCFGRLKRWERIAAYSWTPDSKVFLRMRGRMARLTSGAMPVSDEHRDAIDSALRNHGVLSEVW